MRALSVSVLAPFALAAMAWAAPVLEESFDEQGRWKKNLRGKGAIELADGGVEGKCLKVTSAEQALAYYSIDLDPQRVRGKRLIIRAKVKLDNVVVGPESYSTAKLHVGIVVAKTMQHRAQRFVGTRDWHDQVLIAPIPDDADRVVLDLGIQNGTGTAYFDSLVVTDGVTEHIPLDIKPAANASCHGAALGVGGELVDTGLKELASLPVADIRLAGADFRILHAGENFGRTCLVLRGHKQPRLPARIETVIPVGQKGSRLFFLGAAAWADARRKAPCLTCTVHYADGKSIEIPMREGIDIGAFHNPADLPNWKVAWTSKQSGGTIGLGVTTWQNPRPSVSLKFLRLSTPGTGAVPIVVAISLDPKVR